MRSKLFRKLRAPCIISPSGGYEEWANLQPAGHQVRAALCHSKLVQEPEFLVILLLTFCLLIIHRQLWLETLFAVSVAKSKSRALPCRTPEDKCLSNEVPNSDVAATGFKVRPFELENLAGS